MLAKLKELYEFSVNVPCLQVFKSYTNNTFNVIRPLTVILYSFSVTVVTYVGILQIKGMMFYKDNLICPIQSDI